MHRFTLWSVATTVVSGLLVLPITTSADAAPAAEPPPDSAFEKVTLNDRPGEPMDLAVLPNNDVLHVTRAGAVWLNEARSGVNRQIAQLDVYQHDEEGLQSTPSTRTSRTTTGSTCTTRRRWTLRSTTPRPPTSTSATRL